MGGGQQRVGGGVGGGSIGGGGVNSGHQQWGGYLVYKGRYK